MQKIESKDTGILEYFIKFNADKHDRLLKIRSVVQEHFPTASERIYYGIPTVEIDDRNILHYAAYKNHISIIIGYALAAYLQENYPEYSYTRATVIFVDDKPLPVAFISDICKMLV